MQITIANMIPMSPTIPAMAPAELPSKNGMNSSILASITGVVNNHSLFIFFVFSSYIYVSFVVSWVSLVLLVLAS